MGAEKAEKTALGALYEEMGISGAVCELGEEILSSLRERFEEIDRTAEYNQLKVLGAMRKNRISAEHMNGT